MSNTFAYIILQYCHSVLTREAINVGVLFKFADENKVRLHLKDKHNLNLIYKNFDIKAFDLALEHIAQGLERYNREIRGSGTKLDQNFTESMRHHLKWQDSILQFSDPFVSVSINNNESTVDYYLQLLLNN